MNENSELGGSQLEQRYVSLDENNLDVYEFLSMIHASFKLGNINGPTGKQRLLTARESDICDDVSGSRNVIYSQFARFHVKLVEYEWKYRLFKMYELRSEGLNYI